MKILVLTSHSPSLFWFRLDMMKSFVEKNHEVMAVGNEPESKWCEKLKRYHVQYKQITISRNSLNPFKDLITLSSIKSVIRDYQPDKIFTYQAKTVVYGGIAANQLGIKEVYPLIAGVGSLFLSNDIKTRVVRKITIAGYRLSMRNCPAVFFQNHEDENNFIKTKVIKNQKRVFLRGSGVNLDRFAQQSLPDTVGFLCTCRLIKDKGVFEYIEACRIIKKNNPNVRCMLLGPFDSNPTSIKPKELQVFIDEGTIEYFGEQEDVRPYLERCSVFVLPSYREGTSKAVLEAMSSGKAIITTNAPGCVETVDDNLNGLMVPVKDVQSLANAMQYMIDNPARLQEMASHARSKAEEQFDVNKVNATICETMGL